MDRFRCDKPALKIGVNRSGCSRSFVAGVNSPRARLFFAGRKKRAKSEQMIDRSDEPVDTAVFHAQTAQIFERLLFAKINQLALDVRAAHNRYSADTVVPVTLNKIDV